MNTPMNTPKFTPEHMYSAITLCPYGPVPRAPQRQLVRIAPPSTAAKSSVIAFARFEDADRFRRLAEGHRCKTGRWPELSEGGFQMACEPEDFHDPPEDYHHETRVEGLTGFQLLSLASGLVADLVLVTYLGMDPVSCALASLNLSKVYCTSDPRRVFEGRLGRDRADRFEPPM